MRIIILFLSEMETFFAAEKRRYTSIKFWKNLRVAKLNPREKLLISKFAKINPNEKNKFCEFLSSQKFLLAKICPNKVERFSSLSQLLAALCVSTREKQTATIILIVSHQCRVSTRPENPGNPGKVLEFNSVLENVLEFAFFHHLSWKCPWSFFVTNNPVIFKGFSW